MTKKSPWRHIASKSEALPAYETTGRHRTSNKSFWRTNRGLLKARSVVVGDSALPGFLPASWLLSLFSAQFVYWVLKSYRSVHFFRSHTPHFVRLARPGKRRLPAAFARQGFPAPAVRLQVLRKRRRNFVLMLYILNLWRRAQDKHKITAANTSKIILSIRMRFCHNAPSFDKSFYPIVSGILRKVKLQILTKFLIPRKNYPALFLKQKSK